MLMYVDELIREIEDLSEYAAIVREKFEGDRDPAELLLDARCLQMRATSLNAMMPDGTNTGNLLRHAGFMVYWLKKADIDSCRQDIKDIVDSDLPESKAQVAKWSRQLVYVDVDLREQVLPLLRTKQFDSAVRKAFIILKARLCAKFGMDQPQDGARLINQIFGSDSPYHPITLHLGLALQMVKRILAFL